MGAPRPLQRILASEAGLATWQARHARETSLTRAVRDMLPRQLGERVRAAEMPDGSIELVTSAGAVAAAVRQRAPELVDALVRAGWPCTGLRVRVEVRTEPPRPPRKAPAVPDRAALAPMARLQQTLPQGPLKLALARLLRRTGGT